LVFSTVRLHALDRGRLANIANRGPVGTGTGIMIPGFAMVGTTPKTLVIRGVGPTLGSFEVAGTIADPTISLFSGQTLLFTNDNWQDGGNALELAAAFLSVGAWLRFTIPRPGSKVLTY